MSVYFLFSFRPFQVTADGGFYNGKDIMKTGINEIMYDIPMKCILY